MVSATVLYRVAAILLVLFAAGHTAGFLRFSPPSAEGQAVRSAMSTVTFTVAGKTHSYARFYEGFGLTITVYLFFAAFLAWHLGGLAARDPGAIGALGWVFCVVQLVSFALSWRYFFVAPALFSAVVAGLLAWAAWLLRAA